MEEASVSGTGQDDDIDDSLITIGGQVVAKDDAPVDQFTVGVGEDQATCLADCQGICQTGGDLDQGACQGGVEVVDQDPCQVDRKNADLITCQEGGENEHQATCQGEGEVVNQPTGQEGGDVAEQGDVVHLDGLGCIQVDSKPWPSACI